VRAEPTRTTNETILSDRRDVRTMLFVWKTDFRMTSSVWENIIETIAIFYRLDTVRMRVCFFMCWVFRKKKLYLHNDDSVVGNVRSPYWFVYNFPTRQCDLIVYVRREIHRVWCSHRRSRTRYTYTTCVKWNCLPVGARDVDDNVAIFCFRYCPKTNFFFFSRLFSNNMLFYETRHSITDES